MFRGFALTIAIAFGLGACDAERADISQPDPTRADTAGAVSNAPTAPSPSDEPAAVGDTAARPATRRDTMLLEGDPHPFEARRADAGLYTVYYPHEQMLLEQSSSDEGEGLRFIANFGGTRNDSAFLHIFTPNDPKAGPEAMRRLLLDNTGIVRSNGWGWTAEQSTAGRCPWALESFRIKGPAGSDIIGFACIGEHRSRGIVVVAAYPAEYAEGIGPRIAGILESLEWRDTRTGLSHDRTATRKLDDGGH